MKKYLFYSLVVFLILPITTLAISGDFTVKTTIVNDSTPPTTPTLLSATPIAPTQIDVTWSASTDDYLLGGYVLLRDGIPRATTTLTSFSDTGLTPTTTYSYEVYAFDYFYNLSTTSNAIATTTFDAPITPTTTASTTAPGTGTVMLILNKFSTEVSVNSAKLLWQTNVPSRYVLRWGRTDTYDGGYVVNETYLSSHNTTISNLEPGTVYRFELLGTTPTGVNIVLKIGEFRTEVSKIPTVTQNVERLEAAAQGEDVRLSWRLPDGSDIQKVRIVRNHLGFPVDSNDGAVVYEGTDLSYLDKNALRVYSPQYYTVFAIGRDGTLSSGAVARVFRSGESGTEGGAGSSTTPPIIDETPEVLMFGFDTNNIVIIQKEILSTFLSDRIALSHREPFTIRIPYDSVPKHLKSIIVTLLDPTDQRRSYSFLLRINKDGTAYEATIAPLNVLGVSRLQVEIFDFERMLVGKYRKQIDFVSMGDSKPVVIFPDALIAPWLGFSKILILSGGSLLLLLLLLLLWRRRKKDEDKK